MFNSAPSFNTPPELFRHPFGSTLDPENRFIILADKIHWDGLAEVYNASLDKTKGGPSINIRMILNTLTLQQFEKLGDHAVI